MSEEINAVQITASLVDKHELKYTPAGIAVFEGTFHYSGDVYEAGGMRHLEFDFSAVSFADTAVGLEKTALGSKVHMKGFLSPRTMRFSRLTVHVTEYKIN